jgi:Cu+-exporting ATPase
VKNIIVGKASVMNEKSNHESHGGHHGPAHHRDADSAVARSEIDPVCGMSVGATAERSVEHRGHKYFFCSNGCRDRFAADPEQYLKPKPPLSSQPPAGAIYTCPMHPEIRRDRPGKSPLRLHPG